MNLIEKQKAFSLFVSRLIQQAHVFGYEVTLGEVWRAPATAAANEKNGKGISNSLHCLKLAIDLNLFYADRFLIKTPDYEHLGLWWEQQSTSEIRCCWGGHFGDGNHFSIEHNGVR